MSETITLAINIACLVFLVFGMFWGLIRGFKKTLSRGLFLLLLTVVTIFVTAPTAKLILNIPINFNVQVEGGTSTQETLTLVEFLSKTVEDLLGNDFVSKYPDFASSITAIPLILVNAIVYVVLFWLLKILLLPVNALFTRMFFGNRRKAEVLGFSAMNNSEYPNSDKSIEPLMNIYEKSQNEQNTSGMFIKKEDEINKNAPTAQSDRTSAIEVSQVEKPKTKRELKKIAREEKRANAPKKHRLLGAGVGVLVGLLVMFNTLVPVFGIMDILKTNKSASLQNITSEETSLSTATNGMTDDIIKGYELSALGRVAKYIGMEQLGLVAFDQVTSTKVDNKKIVLRNDVNSLITTVSKADKLLGEYNTISDKGIENITQDELDSLITGLDSLIKSSEEVVLVDALSSYIIPIAVEYIVYNEIQLSDNPVINQAIIDTLVTIAQDNDVAIFKELRTVVDIAKYISDQGLLYHIVSNNYDGILNSIDALDDNFAQTLSDKLFTLRTVNSTLPSLLDLGLKIFDEIANFGYVEGSANAETLKTSITSLLTNLVDIGKSLTYDSSIYVTDSSLVAIGGLLDTFRNSSIFTEDTYNNLVDYAMQAVKQQTISVIPENMKDSFNNHLLRNVGEVTDWKSEMEIIYQALQILRDKDYGILGENVEGKEEKQGYSITIVMEEYTLINIGKALDTLEGSTLFGSLATIKDGESPFTDTTFISLFSSLLNELNESVFAGSTTMARLGNVISRISQNLVHSNHEYSSTETFWQDEMTNVSSLIIEIYNMIDNGGEFEISSTLGSALDLSTHSTMLGDDTTFVLMKELIGIVKDSLVGEGYTALNDDSLNDNIYKLLVSIENNLDITTTDGTVLYSTFKAQNNLVSSAEAEGNGKFWEEEITSIIALKNIADNVSSITTIDSAKGISEDLDLVYTSRIISEDGLNRVIASVLRQLKSGETTGIAGKLDSIIEGIANDISIEGYFDTHSKDQFWQIELEHISTLTNIQLSDSSETSIVDSLPSIGGTLDCITKGNSTLRASYLITENRIRDLLSTVISEQKTTITASFDSSMATTIGSVLDDIAKNIYDSSATSQITISSFETELTHLKNLAGLELSSDIFSATAQDLSALGEKLDAIAYNLTTTTSSEASIQSFDSTVNSRIITRSMISSIIISAFDMAKIVPTESGSDLSPESEMFNDLISSIQPSISAINEVDKVMQWQRELSYIPTLVALNSDEEYTIANAGEKIGANIDLIGFNTLSSGEFADIEYNAQHQIVGNNTYSYTSGGKTKYYNSTIITREILSNTINSLLDTFKKTIPPTEEVSTITEDKIANELIDNLKTNVNTTNTSTTKYNNYTTAFSDLNDVQTQINSISITSDNIDALDGAQIDTMLSGLQNKIVSGVVTTRKLALLIVHKIQELYVGTTGFESTDAGIYLNELKGYYNDRLSNTASENYFIDSSASTSTYDNPFATLKSKLSPST